MGAFSIQLESVKESPEHFLLLSGPDWWEGAREEFQEPSAELREPFALDLEGYRIGARLLFRGRVSGALQLLCGRCAEPYTHAFDERLELLLEPADSVRPTPEAGIELDPEDSGVGRYAGDTLDFEPVLRDILALAWPMQPLCNESCRGLCSICGTNRNVASCSCEGTESPRSFAALGHRLEPSRRNRA